MTTSSITKDTLTNDIVDIAKTINAKLADVMVRAVKIDAGAGSTLLFIDDEVCYSLARIKIEPDLGDRIRYLSDDDDFEGWCTENGVALVSRGADQTLVTVAPNNESAARALRARWA